MKILAIECTHGFASVAVSTAEGVFERRLEEWQKTAEAMVPLVSKVMDEAGVQPSGLDGIAVSSGPGSFTALRIGMSVAKGIAYGAGCPLVPLPTLQVMARMAMEHHGASRIVTVIPSRVGEYFYLICKREGDCLTEIESSRALVASLVSRLLSFGAPLVIAGRSIAELAAAELQLAPCCIEASWFSASSLIEPARQTLTGGFGETLAGVVPDYRQAFVPGGRS
ncbi:MAG: tRNA (adenosine(37)-N6)-threonylcarbamoyltransferase complex dimerization subunit type 1 TsaB [Chlorobiaceae bacterium]|nr:tRNA (adenosine(37)-N6)-threonylcarbamoyltransferase complex dimerization subunit type 1 TsaB [Chlorobiaceae bacterium]